MDVDMYSIGKADIDSLYFCDGTFHCVYALFMGGDIVYIGRTSSLYTRIRHHLYSKYKKHCDSFTYTICRSCEVDYLERLMISKYKPVYNKRLK